MIEIAQPPLIIPAKPAIITAAEPWEVSAYLAMERAGLPRNVRRAVIAELKRLCGVRAKFVRASLDDLSRYAGMRLALIPGLPSAIAAAGVKAPVTATYINGASSTSSGTSHTFSVVSPGTAHKTRKILALIAASGTGTGNLQSATLFGENASILATASTASVTISFVIASLPEGETTGSIIASYGAITKTRASAMWWATYNMSSVLADSDNTKIGELNSTASIDCPAGGAIFAGSHIATAGITSTYTGITKHDDVSFTDGSSSCGSAEFDTAQTGASIGLNLSGGGASNTVKLFVAFPPA